MKLPIKQTDDGEAPLWHDADGKYISYEEITAILNRSPSEAKELPPSDSLELIDGNELHALERDAARYRWAMDNLEDFITICDNNPKDQVNGIIDGAISRASSSAPSSEQGGTK